MQQNSTQNIGKNQQNRSRIALVALTLLFAIPIIGPFFWTPKSFVNNGDLLEPQARSLQNISLRAESGEIVEIDAFKKKWTMLIADDARCDDVCQTNLYNIRQIRFTQGRRMRGVQLVWVLLSGSSEQIDSGLRADYPQVALYTIAPEQSQLIDELFSTKFGKPSERIQRIYLIDPLGNLMMSFDPQIEPKLIQKDLSRLLRISGAGDG